MYARTNSRKGCIIFRNNDILTKIFLFVFILIEFCKESINFSKRLTKKKKKMRIPKLPKNNLVLIIVAIVLQEFEYYYFLALFVGAYALDQV